MTSSISLFTSLGFNQVWFLFVCQNHISALHLCLYVDDILVTGSSKEATSLLVKHLNMEFALKDFRNLNYFLGIQVKTTQSGTLQLSQTKHIRALLEKAKIQETKSISTPMASSTKLSKFEGDILENSQLYRQIVGAL